MQLEEKLNLLSYLESPENIVDLTMNIYDEGDTYLTMVNGDTYYFYDEEEKIKFLRLIFSNELYLIQEFIIKNAISEDLEKYINRKQYIEDKVKEYLPEFRKFQENLFIGEINGVEIYKKHALSLIDAIKEIMNGEDLHYVEHDNSTEYVYNDESYFILSEQEKLDRCESLAKDLLDSELYNIDNEYLRNLILNSNILKSYIDDIYDDFENYMDFEYIDNFEHDGTYYDIFKYR